MVPNAPTICSHEPKQSKSTAEKLSDAYGKDVVIGTRGRAANQLGLDALHVKQGPTLKAELDSNRRSTLANLVTHRRTLDQLAQTAKIIMTAAVLERRRLSYPNQPAIYRPRCKSPRTLPGCSTRLPGWRMTTNNKSKIKMIRTNAALPHVQKETNKRPGQFHVNLRGVVKTRKTTITTMDTLVSATLKSFPADRQKRNEVPTRLANVKSIQAQATEVRDDGIPVPAEVDGLLAQMAHKAV